MLIDRQTRTIKHLGFHMTNVATIKGVCTGAEMTRLKPACALLFVTELVLIIRANFARTTLRANKWAALPKSYAYVHPVGFTAGVVTIRARTRVCVVSTHFPASS
jgi:hypothetical protein